MKKIFCIFIKIILYGLVTFIAIIFIVTFVFWLEHNSSLALPKPTGTYAVGRSTFDWIDSSRTDSLAPSPGIKRELIVWIWYPTSDKKSNSMKLDVCELFLMYI